MVRKQKLHKRCKIILQVFTLRYCMPHLTEDIVTIPAFVPQIQQIQLRKHNSPHYIFPSQGKCHDIFKSN